MSRKKERPIWISCATRSMTYQGKIEICCRDCYDGSSAAAGGAAGHGTEEE